MTLLEFIVQRTQPGMQAVRVGIQLPNKIAAPVPSTAPQSGQAVAVMPHAHAHFGFVEIRSCRLRLTHFVVFKLQLHTHTHTHRKDCCIVLCAGHTAYAL